MDQYEKNDIEILVVEDSMVQAMELKHILQKHGFKVALAHNGEQALEILSAHKPMLVLSDVVMPQMNGYELCEKIKSEEPLSSIPVILLTSLSDPQDVIRGLESGANNFITKPYEERFLLSRIHYMLANIELRNRTHADMGVELLFGGKKHFITSDRFQILDLLISTYETAVQKSKELDQARINYHTLLETNADAIVVVDQEKVVRFVNPAVDTLFGSVGKELLGKPFQFDVVPGQMVEITIPQDNSQPAIAEMRVVETYWEGELAYLASLRDITRRKEMEDELRKLARTDPLTKSLNRRYFFELAENEFERAERYHHSISAIMLDLDHFKRVNDTYGHRAGDRVLQEVANSCRQSLRKIDLVARYGGEEFVILLPETGIEPARLTAERLRKVVEALTVPMDQVMISVTASLGVAGIMADDTFESLGKLLDQADQALYTAKHAGRNRVSVWGD